MPAQPSIEQILRGYAEDYKNDPMAMDSEFGIKVGTEWWSVSVKRRQEARQRGRLIDHVFGPHEVILRKGPPPQPTWYFELADKSVLERIDRGEINAGSASMQSFDADSVMLEVREMEGFTDSARGEADINHATTHFWTKGVPEITYFGRDKSLPTHGASAVGLYAMKGNRIGWFSIGKNEAANADPAMEFGQIPNLIIITKGRGKAKMGQGVIDLKEGMSIFIAPYVSNVMWNPNDEPLEGILVLFGDNSDAAFGKSYIDIRQGLHDFYGKFPFRPRSPQTKP